MTSGIDDQAAWATAEARYRSDLEGLLDRRTTLGALDALIDALRPTRVAIPLDRTAIGLDANVFLRLGNHPRGDDVVDYLGTRHAAPLILPGQAIQEFWNNQLQAVETVSQNLKRKFDAFKGEFSKVDKSFSDFAGKMTESLDQFGKEHGQVYEEATVRKTLNLLDVLKKRARVPYSPRLQFREIAAHRKRTKTPPGFKDDGDGDFFIWVDLLTGLQHARHDGLAFDRVVLVSHDQKPDWIRGSSAHPILVAEVQALLKVPFEIWTIERLAAEIATAT